MEYSSKMSSRSPPPLNAKVSQMKLTGFPLYSTYSSSSLSISLGNDKQYSPNSSEVIIIAQCKTASIYYYSIFITCISLYFCFFLWLLNKFKIKIQKYYKKYKMVYVHIKCLKWIKTCICILLIYLHIVSYPTTKSTWEKISKKLLINKNDETAFFLALWGNILDELQYTVLTLYKDIVTNNYR